MIRVLPVRATGRCRRRALLRRMRARTAGIAASGSGMYFVRTRMACVPVITCSAVKSPLSANATAAATASASMSVLRGTFCAMTAKRRSLATVCMRVAIRPRDSTRISASASASSAFSSEVGARFCGGGEAEEFALPCFERGCEFYVVVAIDGVAGADGGVKGGGADAFDELRERRTEYGVAAFGDDALVPRSCARRVLRGRRVAVRWLLRSRRPTIRCGRRVRPFLPARRPPSGGACRVGNSVGRSSMRTGRC